MSLARTRCFFIMMFLSFNALAESAGTKPSAAPLMARSMIEMTLALSAIILVILICAWGFRRINHGNFLGNPSLKMIAGVPVGQSERIVVFQAGEKQLLLGITKHAISLLHTFDEPIIKASESSMMDFRSHLKRMMGKGDSA